MTKSAQGEDRSSFQSVSGWSGLDFGFAKATEGTGWTDPTFAANWANLKAAGIPRGAYHFFHPGADAVKQAQFFVSTVKAAGLAPGDMLVVDSEIMSGVREYRASIPEDLAPTGRQVDEATLAFLDEVKSLVPADVVLMTYSDFSIASKLYRTAAKYPLLWIAWPNSTAPTAAQCAPFPGWKFWQWGQNAHGIDMDAYNGTAADLDTWIKSFKPAPKTVVVRFRVRSRVTLAGVAERHHTTPERMLHLAAERHHKYRPAMKRYIARGDWHRFLPIGVILFAEETAR